MEFPTETAEPSGDGGAESWLDVGRVDTPIPFAQTGYAIGNSGGETVHYYNVTGNGVLSLLVNSSESSIAKVFASPNAGDYYEYSIGGDVLSRNALSNTYTADGKTVYYYSENPGGWNRIDEVSPRATGTSWNAPQVAWTLIYGTITGGASTIYVNWPRPGGGVLTGSFEITVTAASNDDENDGYSGSGGGTF